MAKDVSKRMKTYKFAYEEHNRGSIEIKASTKEEALDLAQCGGGTIHIYKSDWAIGEMLNKH